MVNTIKDLLNLLTLYFVYLYPGIISVFVFRFIRGRSIVESKITVIKGVTISYIYTTIINVIFKTQVSEYTICQHLLLVTGAFILPVILNAIMRSQKFRCILNWLKINTEISDNLWDLIKSKETRPNKGISVKVFLDKQGIMYEGKLREHEADANKSQLVCLSGYRRYVKQDNSFTVKNDYAGDNSRWVAIKSNDITRIEIKYEDAK